MQARPKYVPGGKSRIGAAQCEELDGEPVPCCLCEINNYLATEIVPEAKGLAIFVRNAPGAFLLPMQFAIPVPDWIAVCHTPSIQPLVELRDCYLSHDGPLATARCAHVLDWM